VRLISLRPDHFSQDSLSDFLEPPETSPDILAAYLRALGDGSITAARNQFLHRVAVHHVRAALHGQPESLSEEVKEFVRYVRTAVTPPQLRSQLGI
jgi:hypothetical protein